MHKNWVVWFEIPVKDLERAIKFYSKVMNVELHGVQEGPVKMAFFPFGDNSVSGALVEGDENNVPGDKGPLIYLNGGDDLAVPLKRVEAAGGKIIQDKRSIGPYGFIAVFKDTEGNRVALHSKAIAEVRK